MGATNPSEQKQTRCPPDFASSASSSSWQPRLLPLIPPPRTSNQLMNTWPSHRAFHDQGNWGNAGLYLPMAPMTGQQGMYTSSAFLKDRSVLMDMCDSYGDACQWFFTADSGPWMAGTGYWTTNTSVDTYIKNSSGTIVTSVSGPKYFRVDQKYYTFCDIYVGWDLPRDIVKQHCDKDPNCSGFIMKKDDSHGDLCQWQQQSEENQVAYFKLP